MSHGHTIPLLHLARLLRQRQVSVTIFTTPANAPSIQSSLKDLNVSVVELPFPKHVEGIPPGVENTEGLPSISSFYKLAQATKLMQPRFEQVLKTLQPISCIISDGFLGWTQETAEKLGIPRFVFFGMNNFVQTMFQILCRERPHAGAVSQDEPFSVPGFPWLELTMNDFDPPFNEFEPSGPLVEFMVEQNIAVEKSYGMITNSFYELEPKYTDYWNQKLEPKSWCVGPLCLARPSSSQTSKSRPAWMKWLDQKLAAGEPVLYISFGTQAEVSPEQLHEIAKGVERAKVNFLWLIRSRHIEDLKGFEERVKDRGLVVKEWVEQNEILKHESIQWFLSHCGWNSLMESTCAKVPILALPFMADQHLNARMMVEEIGVGLRIMPRGGSVRGFVVAEEVEKKVREMVKGQRGAEVRKMVEKLGDAAAEAVGEGGSSWRSLGMLIDDICGAKPHA